jgi:hypothetical protein
MVGQRNCTEKFQEKKRTFSAGKMLFRLIAAMLE